MTVSSFHGPSRHAPMQRGAGNVIVLKSSIAVQEGASTQSNAIGCIDLRSGLLAAGKQKENKSWEFDFPVSVTRPRRGRAGRVQRCAISAGSWGRCRPFERSGGACPGAWVPHNPEKV